MSVASICFFLAGAVGAQQAQERAPVPEAAALKDAEKLIKDLFKDDYAKKAPADRILLAKTLLDQSESTKDDPASRYVLLRECCGIAAAAGDVATAMKAADEMGRSFKIDILSFKAETLQTLAKNAKSQDDLAQVSAAFLKLSHEATDVDDFPAAEKAAATAGAQARKGQNLLLVNRAAARVKEIADLKGIHGKLRKSKEALAANPEDGVANLDVGQYECFTKGNWAVGLPLLAKSADPVLKDLALRDLASTSAPAEQALIGDGWWDLAEKRPPATREHLRARAALWYEKAAGKLTGLSLVKTEKRLVELRGESLGRGAWIDVSDPKLYGAGGKTLTITSGYAFRLSKPPEGEFDGFSVLVKIPAGNDIRIQYELGQKALVVYHKSGQVQSAALDANTWRAEKWIQVPSKEEYLFHVLLAGGEYVGYLDTREFFRLPARRESFTPFDLYVFGAKGGEASFEQIKLRKRQ